MSTCLDNMGHSFIYFGSNSDCEHHKEKMGQEQMDQTHFGHIYCNHTTNSVAV